MFLVILLLVASALPDRAGTRRATPVISLPKAVAGRQPPEPLRIDVECLRNEALQTVTLFGSGVGIWERHRQFRLPSAELRALLRGFSRHGFFRMREVHGRTRDAQESAITVTCRVAVSLEDQVKQVTQTDRGERSDALQRLAESVLAACEPRGHSGVTVGSLGEGIEKVASGSLPAEILSLIANHPDGDADEGGWLLRLRGLWLSSESLGAGEGQGGGRGLLLDRRDVAALATDLAASQAWSLPANLSVPGYTEVRLGLLGHDRVIEARPFAGGSTATADEAARFARIRSALRALYERSRRDGRSLAAPPE